MKQNLDIELGRPCYHCGFLSITLKILKCVCFNCSALLCDKNTTAFNEAIQIVNPRDRFNAILELCEKKKECGSVIEEVR